MVKVREINQNFIQTALNQFPSYIKQYSPKDKVLLINFTSILNLYKDACNNRKHLSYKITEYINKNLGTDQYLKTPFLWFSVDYFQNANLLLEISKFHADNFYEFLARHIRSKSNIYGLFYLLKQNTPLTDLQWELLQYECNKIPYPLTNTQLEMIIALNNCIQEEGIHILDQRKLIESIKERVNTSSILHLSPELKRFFKLIEGQWYLRFHSPAFGFDRIFFHIQIQNGIELNRMFQSLDQNAIRLNSSDFYKIRTNPETFIGIILVTSQSLNTFRKHLRGMEEDSKILIKNIAKIRYIRRSISTDLYDLEKGWVTLNKAALRRLKESILGDTLTEISSKMFLSPIPNLNWKYVNHPLSRQLEKLYSNIPDVFTYENLPLSSSSSGQESILTRNEIGLLKLLYSNKVVHVGFIPYRLIYEFSIDEYWLQLPELSENQLKKLLSVIPYCEIYNIEKSILIWTRLMGYQVDWIRNELKWDVLPILRVTIDNQTKNQNSRLKR